jgi:hypothetical protein
MPDLQPTFKSGDVLVADVINELVRQGYFDIRAGGGINVRRSANNQVQISRTNSLQGVFKGKTSGAITARTSDSAHGTGTVAIWVKNPSTGNYIDSGTTATVDYISSTTGGLATGTWVICAYREDGSAEIIAVDCGN